MAVMLFRLFDDLYSKNLLIIIISLQRIHFRMSARILKIMNISDLYISGKF
jgi:hypothetical protein